MTASEAETACSIHNGTEEHILMAPALDNMEKLVKTTEEQDPFDYEDLILPDNEEDNEIKEKANGAAKL